MAWTILGDVLRWLLLGGFFGLLTFTTFQLLTGAIVIDGLLLSEGGDAPSFHRLQYLAITLVFVAGYLLAALAKAPGEAMPDVPEALLFMMFGSHGIYLAGKVLASRT